MNSIFWVLLWPDAVGHPKARYSARHSNFGMVPSPAMTVLNLNNASAHLGSRHA